MTEPPYVSEYQAGYIHRGKTMAEYIAEAEEAAEKTNERLLRRRWRDAVAKFPPDVIVADTTDALRRPTEVRVTDPETGGQKGQKAEQYSLLPVAALAEVARVYGYGAEKYDRENWRKGYAWHLSYDAAQRHMNLFWGGEDLDQESGLPHLAHAQFHMLTLLTYMLDPKHKSKDDRP